MQHSSCVQIMVYNHHHHSGHFKSIAPYLTDKGEHTALYKINDTMAASAVGTFNVRADVMHAIAHGGCTDTVRLQSQH